MEVTPTQFISLISGSVFIHAFSVYTSGFSADIGQRLASLPKILKLGFGMWLSHLQVVPTWSSCLGQLVKPDRVVSKSSKNLKNEKPLKKLKIKTNNL